MKTTADTITDNLSIGLAPIESETAEYLILGTLPGAESLEKQQYYANKKNQFWTIMSNLLKEEKLIEVSYDERVGIIKRHNIALWDVLKGANRDGSSANTRLSLPGKIKDWGQLFK